MHLVNIDFLYTGCGRDNVGFLPAQILLSLTVSLRKCNHSTLR